MIKNPVVVVGPFAMQVVKGECDENYRDCHTNATLTFLFRDFGVGESGVVFLACVVFDERLSKQCKTQYQQCVKNLSKPNC